VPLDRHNLSIKFTISAIPIEDCIHATNTFIIMYGYPSIFVDTGPSTVRSIPAKEQFHSSVLKLDSWIPQNYLPPAQRAPTQRAAFSHCHRHSGSNPAKGLLAQPHTWKPAKWSRASRASFLPAGAPTLGAIDAPSGESA
jgi:hypothetical protein